MARRTERRNVEARAVADYDELRGAGAGAFYYTGIHGVEDPGPFGIMFSCPCGCGAVHGPGFDNRPAGSVVEGRAAWHWDGNKDKPTLTPSLGLHPKDDSAPDGSGYHWHGHLTAGVFQEC